MLKDKIKNLIKIIEGTEIEEIEVSSFWGAQKIRLSKNSKVNNKTLNIPPQTTNEIINDDIKSDVDTNPTNVSPQQNIIEDNEEQKNEEPIISDVNAIDVKAPLVGTYYSSPKPDSPPFVSVGDKVNKGDTICIIEAMKIFNEIESDISGVVTEICVENGSPVEFDQVIIKVSVD